jgi:hypothetical protein
MTIADEFTTQTLKTVKQAQDFALSTINTVSERVAPLLPKVDSLPGRLNELPKATEIVEKAFDLQAALLEASRNVALEATKAFSIRQAPAKKAAAKKASPAPAAAAAE